MTEFSRSRWWKQDWFPGLLLVAVTLLTYQPAWNGAAVYDDDDHLTPPELSSLNGLARIWTELGAVSQYYPIVHSAFWVQHRLWGYSMPGYHLVNILFHALCALLLLKILKRLQIPGAWLAAGIFALHPVAVESVAWISEQKNTISTFFYLAAALAYLNFDGTRRKQFYLGALALFGLGLLSKTVIATLPAALLVVFWWKRGSCSWKRDLTPLIPFFVLGIVAGLFTAWVERKFIGAEGEAFDLSPIQRCLIAGRVIWFYLGKLFWPANLIFIYPRWTVSAAVWWQYLFPAAALLFVAVLCALRRRWRGPLAAVLLFGGTLVPVLGFLNVYPFRYSFVADHYQYLATLGPIALVAAGLTLVFRQGVSSSAAASWSVAAPRRFATESAGGPAQSKTWRFIHQPFFEAAFCGALLITLGVLTWRQCRMYTDVETLWRTTIARNPACFVAHSNLGNYLLQQGQVDEAIHHSRRALEIQPGVAEAHNNLGNAFLQQGQSDEAMRQYRKALEIRPDLAVVWLNLGNLLLQTGQPDEAMAHFQKAVELRPEFVSAHDSLGKVLLQKGRLDEAIVQFRRALEILPADVETLSHLGNALLQQGQVDDAIVQFQRLLVIQPNDARARNDLGTALVQSGRVEEALAQFQKAVELRPDFVVARHNLGAALQKRGRSDEAIAQFRKIVELQPDSANAQNNLGWILRQNGKLDEAIPHLHKALALRPDYSEARYNLGKTLLQKGQVREALADFRAVLVIQPNDAITLSALAWLLATWPEASVRSGAEAIELAQRANHLSGEKDPAALRALAAAFAECGRFAEAITAAESALKLAAVQSDPILSEALRAELKLYQANSPYREPGAR